MARPLLAFLHVAKTGGRSIETLLRSTYGPAYCHAIPWRPHLPPGTTGVSQVIAIYDRADFRRLWRLCPFMRAIGGHALTLETALHEVRPVRYFTFLREPVARMASHFQFHRTTEARPLDFEAWCDWPVAREHQLKPFSREEDPQAALAAIRRHDVFVGLQERFDESVLMLRKLVAPELNPAYRRTNVAGTNELARELLADPGRRARLQEMVRGEQWLYDRVREEIYPRQVEAYGPAALAADLQRFQADHEAGFSGFNDRLNRAFWKLWLNPWVHLHRRSHGH